MQPFTQPDGQKTLVVLQGGHKAFGREAMWDGGSECFSQDRHNHVTRQKRMNEDQFFIYVVPVKTSLLNK